MVRVKRMFVCTHTRFARVCSMRRGIGAASIVKRRERDNKLEQMGVEMNATRIEDAKIHLETFRSRLTEFAEKHRHRIQEDSAFREQFVSMCESVGVDPVRSSRSGIFGDFFGTFYSDLAVQILTQCLVHRKSHGALFPIDACIKCMQQPVFSSYIIRAIKSLECLGAGGVRIIKIQNETFISSLPDEMEPDSLVLLSSWINGLTVSEISEKKKFSVPRILHAINILIKQGVVWIDTHCGESRYWISPSNASIYVICCSSTVCHHILLKIHFDS